MKYSINGRQSRRDRERLFSNSSGQYVFDPESGFLSIELAGASFPVTNDFHASLAACDFVLLEAIMEMQELRMPIDWYVIGGCDDVSRTRSFDFSEGCNLQLSNCCLKPLGDVSVDKRQTIKAIVMIGECEDSCNDCSRRFLVASINDNKSIRSVRLRRMLMLSAVTANKIQ